MCPVLELSTGSNPGAPANWAGDAMDGAAAGGLDVDEDEMCTADLCLVGPAVAAATATSGGDGDDTCIADLVATAALEAQAAPAAQQGLQ